MVVQIAGQARKAQKPGALCSGTYLIKQLFFDTRSKNHSYDDDVNTHGVSFHIFGRSKKGKPAM